MKYLGTIKY